jgi:hypothetical protein
MAFGGSFVADRASRQLDRICSGSNVTLVPIHRPSESEMQADRRALLPLRSPQRFFSLWGSQNFDRAFAGLGKLGSDHRFDGDRADGAA